MIKSLTIILISILPLNILRIFFYRLIFNYQIDYNSFIGFCVFINSKNCKIQNTQIGFLNLFKINEILILDTKIKNFNIFKNFKILRINEKSFIKNYNKFYGKNEINNNSKLEISKNSEIGNENFFDLSGNIEINQNSKILNYCQIWTHGFSSDRKIKIGNVELGENVYLEDGVTIISDVKIVHNCVIKIASVVTKSINEPNIYSSNKLIKK